MPLPPDKQARLHKMTACQENPGQINHWLMTFCHLSFKEATEARYAATKWLKDNPDEQTTLSQTCANDWEKEAVAQTQSVRSSAQRQNRDAQSPGEGGQESAGESEEDPRSFEERLYSKEEVGIQCVPQEETQCLTCERSGFDCDCKVKRIKDIPF